MVRLCPSIQVSIPNYLMDYDDLHYLPHPPPKKKIYTLLYLSYWGGGGTYIKNNQGNVI